MSTENVHTKKGGHDNEVIVAIIVDINVVDVDDAMKLILQVEIEMACWFEVDTHLIAF